MKYSISRLFYDNTAKYDKHSRSTTAAVAPGPNGTASQRETCVLANAGNGLILIEFNLGYVLDVVGDAQLFAEHAGRSELAVDDVRLAIEGKLSHSFTPLPSNEVLAGLADVKNSAPLPLFSEKLGLRLPPERHTLTGVNFHILPKVH
ncbi:Transcription initiation factor TFIID subunit 9B [Entophlyctis sp. JEL0112]|nr:Transcription initiation factor TFIID subunit 9B [Entophlyctis sp. JEL0112]